MKKKLIVPKKLDKHRHRKLGIYMPEDLISRIREYVKSLPHKTPHSVVIRDWCEQGLLRDQLKRK
jgi:hypothetical protein